MAETTVKNGSRTGDKVQKKKPGRPKGSKNKKTMQPKVIKGSYVDLSLPTMDSGYYQVRRLQTYLGPRQRKALRCIYDGLQYNDDRLKNDKPVKTQHDVVRWMLDKVADELGLDVGVND